jgi:hypothetical protein
MRTLIGLLFGAVLAAGLASPAAAQRRSFSMARTGMALRGAIARAPGGALPARSFTARAGRTRPVTLRTVPAAAAPSRAGLGTAPIVTNGIGGFSPLGVDQLLNPVPGLGFDFTHLAAVNENLDIRALIDPITQQRLALAERLLRESPQLPAVFPAFASSPVVLVESPPPVVVLQQLPPAPAPAAQAAQAPAPAAAVAAAAPPLPVGDLILVRKDGSRIRAAAFAQQGKQIVYITDAGARRSIALADLDVDATRQANEAKGTFLRFSL